MSTQPKPISTFYWWLGGLCFAGFAVTMYLLLDAEVTMRWAHNQYEIHQETAIGLSGLIWLPTFVFFAAVRALYLYVRRSKSTIA